MCSVLCNVIFNDQLVGGCMDDCGLCGKTTLELVYLVVEVVDNYAALWLGNVSQYMFGVSPVFSVILGLMLGQIYASDLWSVLVYAVKLIWRAECCIITVPCKMCVWVS